MNKFSKGCLILCLVLVCVSAVCMGAGIAMGGSMREVQTLADEGAFDIGGWNIGKHQFYFGPQDEAGAEGEEVIEGSVVETFSSDEIKSLKVDMKYGEISFTDSESGAIEISVDAPKRNTYQCFNDNGTLKLEDDTRTRVLGWNGFTNSDVTVTIAIPAGKEFEEVEISTNAGVIDAEHAFLAGKIDLELDAGKLTGEKLTAYEEFSVDVGAGSMEIIDFSTEKLEADCGVGEIDISGTVSEKVEADCGVGRITLNLFGKETDYNYELEVGLGEISINGTSYSSLSSHKKIDNGADKKISLDCGVGQIDVTVKE